MLVSTAGDNARHGKVLRKASESPMRLDHAKFHVWAVMTEWIESG